MKHLSWIITLPLTIVAVLFAVANREIVLLNFWPLPWTLPVPVYLLALGSLVAGFLAGGVITWIAAAPRRRRARRTAERARELSREVNELRRRQAAETGASVPAARPEGAPTGTARTASYLPTARPGRGTLEHLPGA